MNNTLKGTSGAISKFNMIDGYKNTVTKAEHVSVIGSENTVENSKSQTVIGDSNKITDRNAGTVPGNRKKGRRMCPTLSSAREMIFPQRHLYERV